MIKTIAVSLFALTIAGAAHAQTYPTRPVRMLTTVTGGSQDLTARFIAPRLSESLGQQVLVDNRGGIISMEVAAKAPPDGYTLLFASGSLWLSQFLRGGVTWDTGRDYVPVVLAATLPNIIAVHPSLPVRSVKELIALSKARAGELNYSSGQAGSSSHLAGELFKSMAKVNLVRVPYKGAGPAMLSLVTGEAQVSFPNTASAMPNMHSGKIRALAVTSAQPSVLAPGLPTAAASGLSGYESKAMLAILAPAKTPEAIVNRLNQEIVRILANPEVKKRMLDSGAEPAGGSPADLAEAIRNDVATTGKLIKDTGIRAE